MMRIPQRLLRRFRKDESGSYAIETVLMLPLLLWSVLAMLTFVDSFRASTENLRITYAIGDMLSREQFPIDHATIAGLAEVYEHITEGSDNVYLRVTSIIWDETNSEHILVWSDVATSDGATQVPSAITQATLSDVTSKLPDLANGDSVIVVETWMDYFPPFEVGIDPRRFNDTTIVSPRFIPVLRWDSGSQSS